MGKDHSTLIYYRDYHRGRYKSDEEYARIYDTLCAELNEDEKAINDIDEIVGVIRMIGQ